MKVLFISNDPTIFDEGSAARMRMRSYAAAIGELHIVSPANKSAMYKQEGSLFLHPVFSWKIFRVRALAHKAHSLISEHDIEIVSAQDPFEHGLAALRAIRDTEAKLHIQVHTDFLSPWFVKGNVRMKFLNGRRYKIADQVLPAARGIRVVSERIKTSLVTHYGARILVPQVLPIAVDATVPEAVSLPEHQFKFVLIAVGRLEIEKHVEDILKALKLLETMYPMVGLFVVGEGSERKRLEKMTQDLCISDKVIFLGERSDARALMKSSHAFIQASVYEGYGRTLIEAALAKVPIITTDVGIVGDVLRNEKEVLAVPVADPAAIAHAITVLIEDNSLRQALPLNAESAARAHLAIVGDLPARIAEDLARTISS